MHIKFDPEHITFQYLRIKSINIGGGFINYIVNEATNKTKKLDCPPAVLNMFSKTYKVGTTYTIPLEVVVALYENTAISIEKSPFNSRSIINHNNEVTDWVPNMFDTFKKALTLLDDNDWFFDGSYIYSFQNSMFSAVTRGKHLTEDGKFRAVKCKAIFVNYIGMNEDVYLEDRQCLAFKTDDKFSISMPIWKSVSLIGESNMRKSGVEVLKLETQFDKIDNAMLVNLQFAIAAGISLSKQFGYHSIEPLQLPRLMIQLKTVNLQLVPQGTRQTFDIGLTFTQAMAWLLGIYDSKVKTFDDMLVMKKVFRYLSTTGIYRRSAIENVMKEDVFEIPLMDVDKLIREMPKTISFNDMLSVIDE